MLSGKDYRFIQTPAMLKFFFLESQATSRSTQESGFPVKSAKKQFTQQHNKFI